MARTLVARAAHGEGYTDEEWAALEAQADVLVRPKWLSASITARGMARAVQCLGARGGVVGVFVRRRELCRHLR